VSDALLHLVTTEQWRAAIAAGVIAPPSLAEVGFVHLSTPAQVHLPADRLLAGRTDVWLLVLDPARIPAEIRWEPGVPTDPESMRFPHAYGPVPLAAVTSVLPYRPFADGRFAAPAVPDQDPAARLAALEPSLLRRVATAEEPVTGGVAVITEPVPASYTHNQLLVDGEASAADVVAEADRVLGAAGLPHRRVRLSGPELDATAHGLALRGWSVEKLVGMASPVGALADVPDGPHAEQVERLRLAVTWARGWRRDHPGITEQEIVELRDRYVLEEAVIDLRYLAVFDRAVPVASCVLKIDGATALVDAVATDPDHRGRGHGDTLLRTCRALAAAAGCDLLVLNALVDDFPRRWYGRLGFTELDPLWECTRVLT
jgi:uncharacterized protein (DUF952 family)/GNAT superfamily N-acetyltransferase